MKIPSLPKQIEQTLILFHFACRIDKCNFPPRIFTPKGELRHASCALPISLNEMQRLCPWTKRSENLWILLTTIVYQVLRPARHHLPVLIQEILAKIGKVLAYSTLDSQAVSDPSTKRAQRCLTWLIGREAVFSTWYGRKRNNLVMTRCSDNQIRAMLRSLFLGLDTTMANRPKLNPPFTRQPLSLSFNTLTIQIVNLT